MSISNHISPNVAIDAHRQQNVEDTISDMQMQVSCISLSRLVRNVPYFNSLEMSSDDLIPVMPGSCVESGG